MATNKNINKNSDDGVFRTPHKVDNLEGEQDIEPRFECPICLQCLTNPVLTTCGHRFCSECIHQWLQTKGSCCPVDNRPLSVTTDLFPDNFTRREIQALETQGSAGRNDQKIYECKNKEVGCAAVFASSEELATHLDTQIQHHLNLLSAAYSKLLNSSLKETKSDGKEQEATVLWDPDPKSPIVAQTDWQGLVRSLYERIVLLEQQNREQGIQIDNLKQQVISNQTGIQKITEDLTTVHCNGTYIWYITNFSDKMKAQLWTPGFYTAPRGYKFCARLNLGQHDKHIIALHIHLMKTDHDHCLDWPFSGRIYFNLVNENTVLNKHDLMVTNPELVAFKRPTADINPRGFGYSEYISIQELSRGYLSNDCLTIKIKVLQTMH